MWLKKIYSYVSSLTGFLLFFIFLIAEPSKPPSSQDQQIVKDLQGLIDFFQEVNDPNDLEKARLRLIALGYGTKYPSLSHLSQQLTKGNILALYNAQYLQRIGQDLPVEELERARHLLKDLLK